MVKAGDKVPQGTLQTTSLGDLSTDELFSGKKVVVFAVPGAFTPTCSKDHAPGFINNADKLKAKGVDTIACISVNDAFVMDAWAKSLGADAGDKVLFLADGNGTFTKAMDLEMDGSGFGLGTRSKRYAMLVEDGVIKQLDVEPGGGLTCSSAENVLGLL